MRTWHSIMRGFPAPGPRPKRRPGEPVDDYRARVEAHGWADYFYRAVHGADPWTKNHVAEIVANRIVSGASLPTAAKEWLLFVLGSLIRDNAVPAAYRGRPADGRAALERQMDLAKFILEHEMAHPKTTVVDRLHQAAAALNVSFATVRAIYYRPVFRDYLATLREVSK